MMASVKSIRARGNRPRLLRIYRRSGRRVDGFRAGRFASEPVNGAAIRAEFADITKRVGLTTQAEGVMNVQPLGCDEDAISGGMSFAGWSYPAPKLHLHVTPPDWTRPRDL